MLGPFAAAQLKLFAYDTELTSFSFRVPAAQQEKFSKNNKD
jgi:hypothetical protein